MFKRQFGLLAAFLCLFLTIGENGYAHSSSGSMSENELYNNVVGVRLEDLSRYSDHVPGIERVINQLPRFESYLYQTRQRVDKVHTTHLRALPYQANGQRVYPMTAFVEYSGNQLYFEQFDVYESLANDRMTARSVESLSLDNTRFEARVGLVKRVLFLEDTRSDIRLVFPLGVGSFDEAVMNRETSLLTPRFKEAYLSKHVAVEERDKPRYFAGKPFIRVLSGSEKKHTGIGFHAQPNLDTFIRAFDSHGCIRMQLDDLGLFYKLVAFNPLTYIPIEISYHLDSTLDHPFPKTQKSYKRVQNVGSSYSPMFTIDRDYLAQTHYKSGRPPVEYLRDFPADHYEEYFDYSSQPCKIKSFGDEPRRGWDKSLTSRLVFQRCKPRERRNRIYRFFVH